MSSVTGTFRGGKVELDRPPPDWEEGTEVEVSKRSSSPLLGMRDEDWPTTPEGVAAHLALMDATPIGFLAPHDEAEWQLAKREQKEWELARWEEHAERMKRNFE
jgi:hypothetical protein